MQRREKRAGMFFILERTKSRGKAEGLPQAPLVGLPKIGQALKIVRQRFLREGALATAAVLLVSAAMRALVAPALWHPSGLIKWGSRSWTMK